MKRWCAEHMEQAYSLAVPAAVEIGVGPNWRTWSKAACGEANGASRLRKTIPAFLLQLSANTQVNDSRSAVSFIDSDA